MTDRVVVTDAPESVAVSVAVVAAVTWLVVTVKVAVVAPAATLTEAGTFADELDEASVITRPEGPAALPSVTVPVTTVEEPPITDAGETETVLRVAGLINSDGLKDALPKDAVITAVVFVETAEVVIVNVPDVAPAATVTLVGVTALVELELNVIVRPPVGAAVLSVTVPVDELPPMTELGLRLKPVNAGGLIVKVPCWLTPLFVPVIVTVVAVETDIVVTFAVATVPLAATSNVAWIVAEELFEERAIVYPPAGAGPLSVTVHVALAPPLMAAGVTTTLKSDGGLIIKVADWVTRPVHSRCGLVTKACSPIGIFVISEL